LNHEHKLGSKVRIINKKAVKLDVSIMHLCKHQGAKLSIHACYMCLLVRICDRLQNGCAQW